MSRDNKIDQFFRKHLDNSSESQNGWNIPPDDLWAVVQEGINQQIKKKKRRVLFWRLGFGALALLLINPFLFLKINQKEIVNQLILQDNEPEALEQLESQLSPSTPLRKVENDEAIVNKTIRISANVKKKMLPLISKQTLAVAVLANKAKAYSEQDQEKRWPHEIPSALSGENKSEMLQKELYLDDYKNASSSEFSTKATPFLPVQAIAEVFFIPKMDDLLDIDPKRAIPEIKIPSWQWELGVSQARYPINPFTIIEVQDIENNKFIDLLSSAYNSRNIVVTNKRKGRLSISSGMYFTQQKIDVAFGFDSLIYESESKRIEDGIKLLTNNITNNNNSENELELQFFSTANVLNGDSLELYGHLPIKLVAYQLPIIWNFHFGRKRLEYLLTVGFSLDFIVITVDELPIEIFKEDILVGNNINFKAFKKKMLGTRLYLGSGFKYHFTEHINASALFKLEPFSKEFSRYEFGVHYKF